LEGPGMIRNEDGRLAGYVYVDVGGRDIGGYVTEAKALAARGLVLPAGYTLRWSGQYENMERVRRRLLFVVPLTLVLVFVLIFHGAVKRVRPKVMTVACAFTGLLPIMFSTGAGADVMKRIAAPMVGGLFSSFALELTVYPAVYLLWKRRELGMQQGRSKPT